MNRPLVGIADAHMADRSKAEDFCEEGFRWSVNTALTVYRPVALVLMGDIFDGGLSPWEVILKKHKFLLMWLDYKAHDAHCPIWWLRGNHEEGSMGRLIPLVKTVMTKSTIVGFEQPIQWEGWTIMHGHQLDPWNSAIPNAFAMVALGIGGLFERVIPGFDTSMLNPTNAFKPPRARRAAGQTKIAENADKYVKKHGGRVFHGHTHRRRISEDRRVVCAGTCTEGRGEFAAIWPDGLAVLHEMTTKE